MTNQICLSVGTNYGNRLQNIVSALEHLSKKQVKDIKTSSIYESEPVGFVSENHFYNIVLIAQTTLTPMELLGVCQCIESEMGRVKTKANQYESRVIDLDIIYYHDLVIKNKDLTIPHPRAHLRLFVALPLFEIINRHDHAVFNSFIRQIKKENLASQKITKVFISYKSKGQTASFHQK